MDIRIEKVKEGMGQTFADYFNNLDFSHEPHWAGCYCRFYFTGAGFSETDLSEWQARSGENNKNEAIDEIDNGSMSGFLAFDEDKCIGWLNANDWKALKRLHEYVSDTVGDKKVGITICYVIHPEYRNRGVATALLKGAIDDFRKQGYDAVLALPVYSKDFSPKLYRGTISMYEKFGFKRLDEFGDLGDVRVYWLDL